MSEEFSRDEQIVAPSGLTRWGRRVWVRSLSAETLVLLKRQNSFRRGKSGGKAGGKSGGFAAGVAKRAKKEARMKEQGQEAQSKTTE